MKRKLSIREQWLDAWRIHRIAYRCDTESRAYTTGDFSPKFKTALDMTERLNYFQAYMPGRYELLAKRMKNAKSRGASVRYMYGGWRNKKQGIQLEVEMASGYWI